MTGNGTRAVLNEYVWAERFLARAEAFRRLLDMAEAAHAAALNQIAEHPDDYLAIATVCAGAASTLRDVVLAIPPGE